MARGKGVNGMTCRQAIKKAATNSGIISTDDLINQVKSLGPWATDGIAQGIMSHTINLLPGYVHWPKAERFLYQHEDGRYEIYNLQVHGDWVGKKSKMEPFIEDAQKRN